MCRSLSPLGQGSFGKVSLAQYKRQRVAIKEIFGELTANAHKSLMEEIRIMFHRKTNGFPIEDAKGSTQLLDHFSASLLISYP
jgi:serine/threonine protein kinase